MAVNDTNLRRVQAALKDGRIRADALLLTSHINRYFATGFPSSAGMALITAENCIFITDFRYFEAAQNALPHMELRMIKRGEKYSDLINEKLDAWQIATLAFEDGETSVAEYNTLKAALKAELVPVGQQINYLRAAKTEDELDNMRKAQQITDAAFEKVLEDIHAGMTEKEVEARLIFHLYNCGGEKLSFDPIVVSGPNSSLPHGHATERVIENGDFVTMDFGVLYNGYCSDMTRTVAVGYVTEEMEKVYNTVLQAQLAGIAATCAGVPGKEIDGAARKVIEDAGYGPYFGHGYGHSLGLEVHESPSPNPSNDKPMPAGAVTSAEPGIYLPGKFGVRIEDVVIIAENGCENITFSPKNLIII